MRTAVSEVPVDEQDTRTDTQDIDDFIYLISHDVRASVRALIELPQWIVEDLEEAGIKINGSVAQSVEMMNRHTARLDRMLIDLLAYSRIGRMQDVLRVDIEAALDDVLAALRIPEGIELTRDIASAYAVMGDQDALTLWSAVIGNAIKHRPGEAGRIHVSTQTEGAMIRFTVVDDGPGIPSAMRAKAVSPMTTLRPRDEVEGTGMGLANLRKMAAHYGGEMTLSDASEDSSGLRVDIVIPHGC
ncbi:MAG: HAMP domain-containing sensor histidine kinase [Sulfitobacter sp.]